MHWPALLLASAVWMASYAQLVQLWASQPPVVERIPSPRADASVVVSGGADLLRLEPRAIRAWRRLAVRRFGGDEQRGGRVTRRRIGGGLAAAAGAPGDRLRPDPERRSARARRVDETLDTASQLVLGVLLTAVLIVAVRERCRSRARGRSGSRRAVPLPAPPPRAFALYVVRAALGWVGYGLAFWLFGRALFGDDAPHIWLAGTSYVGAISWG